MENEKEEVNSFNPLNITNETELWMHLTKPPEPSYIKNLNNIDYLPISYIEAQLRRFFGPMGFQIKNGKWTVIVNETVGSVEVWIRHPLTKEWQCYEGWAATQIQMAKGAKVMDAASKYVNSQQKMHPNLKSRCIANAVKPLGNAFGGNLGRKEGDQETISQEIGKEILTDILAKIEFCENKEDLDALKLEMPNNFWTFSGIRKRLLEAENSFSQNQLPEKADAQTLFNQP